MRKQLKLKCQEQNLSNLVQDKALIRIEVSNDVHQPIPLSSYGQPSKNHFAHFLVDSSILYPSLSLFFRLQVMFFKVLLTLVFFNFLILSICCLVRHPLPPPLPSNTDKHAQYVVNCRYTFVFFIIASCLIFF